MAGIWRAERSEKKDLEGWIKGLLNGPSFQVEEYVALTMELSTNSTRYALGIIFELLNTAAEMHGKKRHVNITKILTQLTLGNMMLRRTVPLLLIIGGNGCVAAKG